MLRLACEVSDCRWLVFYWGFGTLWFWKLDNCGRKSTSTVLLVSTSSNTIPALSCNPRTQTLRSHRPIVASYRFHIVIHFLVFFTISPGRRPDSRCITSNLSELHSSQHLRTRINHVNTTRGKCFRTKDQLQILRRMCSDLTSENYVIRRFHHKADVWTLRPGLEFTASVAMDCTLQHLAHS